MLYRAVAKRKTMYTDNEINYVKHKGSKHNKVVQYLPAHHWIIALKMTEVSKEVAKLRGRPRLSYLKDAGPCRDAFSSK